MAQHRQAPSQFKEEPGHDSLQNHGASSSKAPSTLDSSVPEDDACRKVGPGADLAVGAPGAATGAVAGLQGPLGGHYQRSQLGSPMALAEVRMGPGLGPWMVDFNGGPKVSTAVWCGWKLSEGYLPSPVAISLHFDDTRATVSPGQLCHKLWVLGRLRPFLSQAEPAKPGGEEVSSTDAIEQRAGRSQRLDTQNRCRGIFKPVGLPPGGSRKAVEASRW
ncbi:hypothetical protein QBC34DRAFT_422085 [Podospora aff. communis PSN243]|uniref:Uncharacterized protein n=1 Tax=Podospora aff. communis PSN243 TaxID=3040156 RepID=A0AAV9GYT8_9PEZI|nr:hypothetical protein QBC34DRAFT_422085 [Podospora aff. communis PSN243]